jgi:hypothetical protein
VSYGGLETFTGRINLQISVQDHVKWEQFQQDAKLKLGHVKRGKFPFLAKCRAFRYQIFIVFEFQPENDTCHFEFDLLGFNGDLNINIVKSFADLSDKNAIQVFYFQRSPMILF